MPTEVELLAPGNEAGMNGKTNMVAGSPDLPPIGGDQDEDQFRDISRIIGSETEIDTLIAFDLLGTWTIDDDNSYYEVNHSGEDLRLDFSHWDTIFASSLDDTFNVKSNSLERLRLNALAGNDTYNFSSDAPNNAGTTENIGA